MSTGTLCSMKERNQLIYSDPNQTSPDTVPQYTQGEGSLTDLTVSFYSFIFELFHIPKRKRMESEEKRDFQGGWAFNLVSAAPQ